MSPTIFRHLSLIALCLFVLSGSRARAQFLVTGGGLNQDEALDIASDASGGSYVTGYFGSTLSFPGGITASSSGLSDIFLLRANSAGQVLWVVKAGGTSDERGNSVCIDNAGNAYITGYFQGTINFGGGTTLTSAGSQDVFVAKYNNAGVLQWARRAGGTGADIGSGIAVDNNGNVAVTGEFKNTADFGSVTLTADASDAFVCKYDAAGTLLWAKKGGGLDNSRGLDLAFDATGNIYATGQFSNDITFDVLQTNNIFNAIYLVKFNGAGNEQWFRKIGGATNNIAYSVDVDAGSNVYITGDFTGNLVFFPNTGAPLTNTYPNRIFVAKYNSAGNLEWSRADGSSSEISSRRVTVGANGQVFIGGWFKCTFSEYSDNYGEGTFNSVGYRDGFVARYDASGNWTWARNFGGQQDEYITGIAPGTGDLPLVSAGFVGNLFVPSVPGYFYDNSRVKDSLAMGQAVYCGDNSYNRYLYTETRGGTDFAFGHLINFDRKPYDYYLRRTGGCNLDQIDVCIAQYADNCPDTLRFCGSGPLYTQSNTNGVGPNFTYRWSTGATTTPLLVGTAGTYSVTQTSADGCYVTTDDIYVVISPLPTVPPISDDVVINNHAVNTQMIEICYPETVDLTGHTMGMPNYQWFGPTGPYPAQDSTITVSQVGQNNMIFSVNDGPGCFRSNTVQVIIYPPLDTLDPHIFCYSDADGNDTVSFCASGQLQFGFFDSLANMPLSCDLYTLSAEISINGGPVTTPTFCVNSGPALYSLTVDSSGWYVIDMLMYQRNICDTIEYRLLDSIYVDLYPLPPVDVSLTGSSYICPNDTVFITGTSTAPFTWGGNNIAYQVDSFTVAVTSPGIVSISASVTDTVTGCQNIDSDTINVQLIVPPLIFPTPGNAVICPGDSLLLSVQDPQYFVSFEWTGPQGTLAATGSSVYVTEPGLYYCVGTSASGCAQLSNTIEVKQYGTPYLMAPASSMLCPGPDTVLVYVVSGPGSQIQWNSPLSGSDTVQAITSPGSYSVQISSCGVTTTATIEVTVSPLAVDITTTEGLTFCEGDSVLLETTNVGAVSFEWAPGGHVGNSYWVYGSGNYRVLVKDSSGCELWSDPVQVSETPDNIPPPIGKDTTFCPAASLQLSATGQGMVYWFSGPSGGTPLDSGHVYQTPVLEEETSYYLQAKYGGCVSDFSMIKIGLANCNTIEMPNIFTPNGDGVNDWVLFNIKDVSCFYAEIRNRWGVKVFESRDATIGWDGTAMQTKQLVVDGTYFYIVDYCPKNGSKKTEKGFITVIRK